MGRPSNNIADVLERLVICEPTTLDTGCWEYLGEPNSGGYKSVRMRGRRQLVHRLVYEHFRGLIPSKLESDHLCRNRGCCNPDHLEMVTTAVNQKRGLRGCLRTLKTHCPRGHLLDADNLYNRPNGDRLCRICLAKKARDWRKQQRENRK